MALFVDGSISTTEDVIAYESSILDVARTEAIELPAKLALAEDELAIELTAYLLQQGYFPGEPGPKLDNVVITTALKKWHIFHALALVYRDAYNSHLNDRYQGKLKEYERLAGWASRWLFQIGVGVVNRPIRRPEKPDLGTIPGSVPSSTYFVEISWVTKDGAESSPSETCTLRSDEGTLLVVTPKGAPASASGWNLYAGFSKDELGLQNDVPIPTPSSWTQPGAGLRSGRKPGRGQELDRLLAPRRILQRG